MSKKRILVCGTGFGKIYLKAIRESKKYELAGVLGRGSARTKKLATNLGVPVYTNVIEATGEIDAACVVVPNAAGGGTGTEIAQKILEQGIPTLLEHPAHEQEIIKCLKVSKNVPFMLNPFYRYIKPVRIFLETAKIMREYSTLLSASLECAIHVLYDGLDILGCALGDLSTWDLGTVAQIPQTSSTGGGNKIIGGVVGTIPVLFTVNTNVDREDMDHPLHLYHRIELTFSTGRLCLVNTHGPVIWMPFLRMPRDEDGTLNTDGGNGIDISSGINIGKILPPSLKQTFDVVWPDAVMQALEVLFRQTNAEKMQMAQYQRYVSRLWSEISKKTGYINLVNFDNTGSVKVILEELQKKGLIEENYSFVQK